MYEELREKDILVLNYIKKHSGNKGYPPSVREICNELGIKSTSTVFGILNRLEKYEYIRKDPTKPRAIEILDKNSENPTITSQEIISLPVVGEIAAGEPIFAEENIQEYIPLPSSYIKGRSCFMLKVKGDSMIDAGIFDRDLIVVDSSDKKPKKGKIIAALIDGNTATVKRLDIRNGKIILIPENKMYSEMVFSPEEVQILGSVTGVFRTL